MHLEFIFMYSIRWGCKFILLHVDIQFSQHHLLKGLPFLRCAFLVPLWKISWPCMCGFISEISTQRMWFYVLVNLEGLQCLRHSQHSAAVRKDGHLLSVVATHPLPHTEVGKWVAIHRRKSPSPWLINDKQKGCQTCIPWVYPSRLIPTLEPQWAQIAVYNPNDLLAQSCTVTSKAQKINHVF